MYKEKIAKNLEELEGDKPFETSESLVEKGRLKVVNAGNVLLSTLDMLTTSGYLYTIKLVDCGKNVELVIFERKEVLNETA